NNEYIDEILLFLNNIEIKTNNNNNNNNISKIKSDKLVLELLWPYLHNIIEKSIIDIEILFISLQNLNIDLFEKQINSLLFYLDLSMRIWLCLPQIEDLLNNLKSNIYESLIKKYKYKIQIKIKIILTLYSLLKYFRYEEDKEDKEDKDKNKEDKNKKDKDEIIIIEKKNLNEFLNKYNFIKNIKISKKWLLIIIKKILKIITFLFEHGYLKENDIYSNFDNLDFDIQIQSIINILLYYDYNYLYENNQLNI
ncbi:DNA double-strand break repair Rad50 ATPase, partial [Reticulomyxa filosa]